MSLSALEYLLSTPHPPSLIHLHHPAHSTAALPTITAHARVDAVEHHTLRLLYSGIIHRLRRSDEGDITGQVESTDTFIRSLRGIWKDLQRSKTHAETNGHGSGKKRKRQDEEQEQEGQAGSKSGHESDTLVIMITKAERLGRVLGPHWSVLTRLGEMAGVPITLILASSVPWDQMRPPRGDCPEPVHIYLPAPTRNELAARLAGQSRHPLWPRYIDLLLSSVFPLTSSLMDIRHLAQTLWPIYTSPLPAHAEQNLLQSHSQDSESEVGHESTSALHPPLGITVKLLTDLKQHLAIPLTSAIENVLTRQMGSHEFLQTTQARSGSGFAAASPLNGGAGSAVPRAGNLELPLLSRFLVVAAYCASYNPAKSDLRLFGRGAGVDRKKRKGGGTRRAGYGRVRLGKVPQYLLGPKPFPLDRFLALFAAIYAEHADRPDDLALALEDDGSDDDTLDSYATAEERVAAVERRRARESEKDERWEEEVEYITMSAKLWTLIPELESQGLLRRMSPSDRLDNIVLRCEVDYETVKSLAKELGMVLDEYLYEAM